VRFYYCVFGWLGLVKIILKYFIKKLANNFNISIILNLRQATVL
jgi:hypothetical protein